MVEQLGVTTLLLVSKKLYVSTNDWLLNMLYVTSFQNVAFRGADAGQVPLTLYVERESYSNCHSGVTQFSESETLAK